MARKKQEIQLQSVIETQEEWEEMLSKEGLTVVDVYQEWAGPCKAMVSNFRRLKNELGDDLLRFAVAKADTVDSLEKYRYTCKPCFLYYAGGVLVAVVRGCNSPLLLKTVTEQLAYEHKVLEGQAERKEIRDTVVDSMAEKEKEEEEEEEEEVQKEVTVALIRPDVVSEGKVDEVIEKMKASGLEILEHQERLLTEEEAREFYSHSKDEEYFEGLIQLMTSGPSHVLVITKGDTGQGVIEQWRELIGPPNVEKAKEEAPDSFRAQFGKEGFANAIHGSDSHETAMKELAFFFPSLAVPTVGGAKPKKTKIQRTLALIRPDAVKDETVRDGLLAKIREAGFEIAMQKEVQITKEQAEEFYKEHKAEEYFDELTTRMSSGPLLALCLAREDAVTNWREMLGPAKLDEAKAEKPDSLRAQFSVEGIEMNQIHGADTEENAEKELGYFFPMQQTVAVIKPDAYENRDQIMDKIKEAGFHIAARKETELTKDIVAQLYKDQQDKEYFGDLTEHMTSGPTLFMVLSGENAVDGWRSKMGPTDPSQAPEDSLRAMFGKDVKANALHGASTEENAKEVIQTVFGEVEFDKQGKLVGGEEEPVGEEKPAESAETQQEQGEDTTQETQQTEQQQGEGESEAKQETTEESKEEEKPAEGETQGEETQAAEEQKAEGEGEQTEQPAESQEEKGEKGQTQETEGGEQTQAESGGGEEGEQKEETTQETEESKGGDEAQQESQGEEKPEATEAGEQPAASTEGGEQQAETTEGTEQQAAEGETEGQQEATEGEAQKDESEGQKEESEGQKEEGEGEKQAEETPATGDGEQTEQTEQTEQGEAKEEDKPAE